MIFFNRLLNSDFTIVVGGKESVKAFKELVQRATNLWPDAPPEIKAFADKVTNADWANGQPLQDYSAQNTSKKPVRCRHYNAVAIPERGEGFLKCLDCGHVRNANHPHTEY